MTIPQYSTDGTTYENFTGAMLAGSYYGMFELLRPQPTVLGLDATPAGAYGLLSAALRSRKLPAAGMAVWLGFFSLPATLKVSFWMDVYDPYVQGLTRISGDLQRPRWGRVQAAQVGGLVYYENAEITLLNGVLAT